MYLNDLPLWFINETNSLEIVQSIQADDLMSTLLDKGIIICMKKGTKYLLSHSSSILHCAMSIESFKKDNWSIEFVRNDQGAKISIPSLDSIRGNTDLEKEFSQFVGSIYHDLQVMWLNQKEGKLV